MKNLKYTFAIALAAMTFFGCSHNHDHDEDKDHDEEEEENAVHFSKEMQDACDFSVATVKKQSIGNIIRTVAEILPSQGEETIISAKTDGVVNLSASSLNEGSEVKVGQVICNIDASSLANNNLSVQHTQAKAEYERAKAEYERVKALREDKLVLASELATAKAAYESAEANYKTLQNNFKGGKQAVTAMRGGFIKQLLVTDGQHVAAGEAIALITQSKTLRLKANVQSSYYNSLKDISGANIRPIDAGSPDAKTYTLAELGGKVLSYGRQTSTSSPLIPVTFEINNIADFVPGTYLEMFIQTRSSAEKTCVPAESVLEDMGSFFVFVQHDDEPDLFEKIQVKVGATDGINTEIISGVKAGDKVVAHGAMLVKMQQAAGGVDPHAGHSH